MIRIGLLLVCLMFATTTTGLAQRATPAAIAAYEEMLAEVEYEKSFDTETETKEESGEEPNTEAKTIELSFTRTPASIAQALSAQTLSAQALSAQTLSAQTLSAREKTAGDPQPDAKPAADPKLSQLHSDVLCGEWKAVQAFFAVAENEKREQVYQQMLATLALSTVVQPQDVLDVADAAPAELSATELTLLAQMLKRGLQTVDHPTSFLSRLKSGTRRLGGGDDLVKRMAAAELLALALRHEEAIELLPKSDATLAVGDPKMCQLLARVQIAIHQSRGSHHSTAELLTSSWELAEKALEKSQAIAEVRAEAINTLLYLLPEIADQAADGDAAAKQRLSKVIKSHPESASEFLVAAGAMHDEAFANRVPEERESATVAATLTVDSVFDALPDATTHTQQLLALTRVWINEAQKCAGYPHRRMQVAEDRKIREISAVEVWRAKPSKQWIAMLDDDTADHVRLLTALLAARFDSQASALEQIKYVASFNDDDAKEVTQSFLSNWSVARVNPDPPERTHGMQIAMETATTLTRAKQVRDLKSLSELVVTLREQKIPGVRSSTIVDLFNNSHSDAELFRKQDIEKVFGPTEKLDRDAAYRMVEIMRNNLATTWRDVSLQETAGTKRTKKQVIQQIINGYKLAGEIAAPQLESNDTSRDLYSLANMRSLVALLKYDESEFLYGQEVDLKTYVTVRDRSFGLHAGASEAYALELKQYFNPMRDTSIATRFTPGTYVHTAWFQSALGVSDLAYLTRQDEADKDQVDLIAESLRTCTEVSGGKVDHMKLFADDCVSMLSNSVPQHMRPVFLSQAIRVLGDHPSAKPLHDRIAYYQELLSEIQLHVSVDGRAEVGEKAFGVHVGLRATEAMHRESNGFRHLLSLNSRSTQNTDTRKAIEEHITETLSDRFFVEAITFAPQNVSTMYFDRPGWVETPLAYVQLRAKEPSVDRIPELRVDLSFQDDGEIVVLPILSQVVLIDARTASPRTAAKDLVVSMLMDDRAQDETEATGAISLQVNMESLGLLGDLDDVLDSHVPGYELAEATDQGLDVAALDSSGESVMPRCTRSWSLKYVPADSAKSVGQFVFPELLSETKELKYERFMDADLVEVDREVNVDAMVVSGRWLATMIAIGIFALGLIGVLVWLASRQGSVEATAAKRYAVPASLTPFTLVSTMKRIADDPAIQWKDEESSSLQRSIQQTEQDYFGKSARVDNENLESVLRPWIDLANQRTRLQTQ